MESIIKEDGKQFGSHSGFTGRAFGGVGGGGGRGGEMLQTSNLTMFRMNWFSFQTCFDLVAIK